jgi:hypothetical protein
VIAEAPADPPRAARPTARARPGAIALYGAYVLAAAAILAAPIAASIHDTVAGYPRGDAELFDQGSLMLYEAVHRSSRALPSLIASTSAVGLAALFLGLFPLAALIAALGREGRLAPSYLAARAVRPIGTLALLWGTAALAQAVLAGLVALLGGKILDWAHPHGPAELYAQVALGAAVLLAVLAAGVARDLAFVSAVNDETRFYTSAARAVRSLPQAFLSWLGRSLLGLAAIALSLRLAPYQSGAVALPLALHQIGIFAAVFCRASWLAAAIRILDRRAPLAAQAAPEATPPRSDS